MRGEMAVILLAIGLMVATAWAFVAGDVNEQGLPSAVLGILALVVTTITLWFVVPRRARILVVRQDELDLADLIFYVGEEEGRRVPLEYLLQLHVAIANLGGRIGVVSRVTIESFHDRAGRVVRLPDTTEHHSAIEYHQQSGYRASIRFFESVSAGGPWLLAPDDVITLRFRTRRGIDWSDRWDLKELRRFHDALVDEIVEAKGVVVWRQGDRILRAPFTVEVRGSQQELFVNSLRVITKDFQERPQVTPRVLHLE